MAKVTVCDRCGKTCATIHARDVKITKFMFHGWLSWCTSHEDIKKDLCPDCTEKLDKFLEGKATDAVVKE